MALSLEDQMLYAEDLEVRRNAAITLSKNPTVEMIPSFLQALSDSEDVSIFAMYGLVKIGSVAVPHVLEMLQNSPHTVTRASCVEILGEIKDPRALPVLLRIAERDPNPWVQSAAIQALGGYKEPEVADLLVRLLDHPDSWIMTLAAVHLFKRHYTEKNLFQIMMERFIRPEETKRGVMAWGLIEVGSQRDVPVLKQVVQGVQDPLVQKMLQEIQKQIAWKK
ncbi:MAG: HEAT repeat domain-containing protein [Brevinematales bacterium]|nr:HEAT repeat domain-containing protein [Brevinematales bacterium]